MAILRARSVPLLLAWGALVSLAGCGGPADHSGADAGVDEGPPCVVPDTGLPTDVFCTGLYLHRSTTQYAPDVMPYTPGVTLWSDGAEKHRYLSLPPGSQIDTTDLDAWQFPVGTKAWKEFKFDGKLVETRLLWKRSATDWEVGTYAWDESGTSATLYTESKGKVLASGYEIPSKKDCDKCHHGASDKLLGVEAVALALPGAQGATLTALAAQGRLTHAPKTTALAFPEDATGKAGAALGYLHANCGMACHSTRGLGEETKLVLRLRASEFWPSGADGAAPPLAANATDIWHATANQEPTTAAVAQHFPGAKRITPGDHELSLVWLVAHLRGNYQMPPLATHRIDDAGTQKIAEWIDALPK